MKMKKSRDGTFPRVSRDESLPGESRSHAPRDVDQGWAWVVLVASISGLSILCFCYIGGIFNIIFLEVFQMSKQKTAWLTAVQGSLMSLAAPVGSLLVARLGHRGACMIGGMVGASGYFLTFFAQGFVSLLLSFGILVGLGFGICYVPCIVVISEYFEKNRNVAFGLSSGLSSIGIVLLPMMTVKLLELFGWRGAMLIISGLYMQLVVFGAIFWPLARKQKPLDVVEVVHSDNSGCPENNVVTKYSEEVLHAKGEQSSLMCDKELGVNCESPKTDEENTLMTDSTLVEIKCSPSHSPEKSERRMFSFMKRLDYILLCVTVFSNTSGTYITYIHFPAFFVKQGSTEQDTALCLMIMGITGISSRLIGGIASNNKAFDVLLVYMVSCCIVAVLLFICPAIATTFTGQIIFSVLFGLYSNWVYSLLAPVTVHILSKNDLNMAFGVESFFGGIGGLIGPPIAGWLYDISGTYIYSFYTAGALYGLSLVMTMLIPVISPTYQKGGTNA